MLSHRIIKNIRIFGVISFLLPLIAINTCLMLFKALGSVDLFFPTLNYEQVKTEYSKEKFYALTDESVKKSIINCPKYIFDSYAITFDNQIGKLDPETGMWGNIGDITRITDGNIDKFFIKKTNLINNRCIKNHPTFYFLAKNIPHLENILINILIRDQKKSIGFGEVKNPYFYGEVSISRTARYFPATFIFKPLVILSAFFLLFYWINNLKIFVELKNITPKKFSKKFFYYGIISCIFLTIHAIFLGIHFDNEAYKLFRRIAITAFILFEVMAQISLTINIYKFKEVLKDYIYIYVLNLKIGYVIIIFLITLMSFTALAMEHVGGNFKNILEWNYFSILLLYYLFNALLWKPLKKT